jgi:lipoprotein NlpD
MMVMTRCFIEPGLTQSGLIRAGVKGSFVILFLILLAGCGHHQPAPVEEHSSAPAKRQLSSDGSYKVRSGDTLYAIAFSYGLDTRSVAKWNGISSPYVIYPGQKLRLTAPPVSRQGPGSGDVQISAAKTPGQATTRTHTQSKPTGDAAKSSPAAAKSSPSTTTPGTKKSSTAGSTTVSNSVDPKSWKWPTKGRVIRGYVAGDPARNGLDIAGREGQTIAASSGGQVVHSGNGLIGYGELIIIKHSEKMLSAYAHNKVRLVKEGDQVSAGQKIAEMGRNAGDEQLLHFEIRARGKPVNPLTYLPGK